eukprot:UN03178
MKVLFLTYVLSVTIPLSSCFFLELFAPRESTCNEDYDCPRLQSSAGICHGSDYRQCADCVNDVDCYGDQYCSGFSCHQRYTSYNPYEGNPSAYVSPEQFAEENNLFLW